VGGDLDEGRAEPNSPFRLAGKIPFLSPALGVLFGSFRLSAGWPSALPVRPTAGAPIGRFLPAGTGELPMKLSICWYGKKRILRHGRFSYEKEVDSSVRVFL